jgi:YbgC/YbaW family acyl-CoA thioester hydrolase
MATEHTERMRVNWVDTDASGLIHNTAALRYFEVAEHALLRRLSSGMAVEAFSMPRVHVEADYWKGLRFPEEFDCTARVDRVGGASVRFGFEIRNLAGERCITGVVVAVAVGPDGRSMPLPARFRAALEKAL